MNELVVADREGTAGLFPEKNSDECESEKYE
jgi:hypothetical protein